jgi:hypothetical protein
MLPPNKLFKMLFIEHFFTIIFAFLVFGSMALAVDQVVLGTFYTKGPQTNIHPPVHLVHALSVIL